MAFFLDWLGRRRDRDLQNEIRSHLEMAARERMADGADEQHARLGALKEFGNVALMREAAARVWRPRWFDAVRDVLIDVRYAFRMLRKSPGFSLIVMAVIALGIGLNAAVFSLFKGIALRPLSGVEGSGRLAVVLSTSTAGRQMPLSYLDYIYLRDHDQAFAGLSGSTLSAFNVGLGHRAERVMGEFVTGNYFQFLGVRTTLGRPLLPSDDIAPGKHPVVVLSHGLWRRTFGADPDIVGKTVHLNARPVTVVGVADPLFHGTIVSFDIEVFVPVMMVQQLGVYQQVQRESGSVLDDRKTPLLMVLGRLRPGIALAEAAAQSAVLSSQLSAGEPLDEVADRLTVLPIWKSAYGAQTYMLPAVVVLGGMGALLLLIVCANIAGLVLVRGVARRGEIAVRLALGASRARVLRLLVIESLALSVPGALAGLLLASYSLPLLWSGATGAAPGRLFLDVSVDVLVMAYVAVASVVSALAFGFIPALRTSRVDLAAVMKDDLSPRGAGRGGFRSGLVIAQVAVSLILLVGAGLVVRSLNAARDADGGFDSSNAVSLALDLGPNGYDESQGRLFYQKLLDAVRADEGIESASLAMAFPMSMVDGDSQKVVVDGYRPREKEELHFLYNVISPDYFRTLRVPVLAGRDFASSDDQSAAQVAVVNETLARRFWQGTSNALGTRLRMASGEWRTIVGVVKDIKYARINENARPYVYLPLLQSYRTGMILHTRGSAALATQIERASAHVEALDSNLPILKAQTLREQTSAALSIFAITARLLFAFGVAAMALAAMGLYGLVSYTVRQSTREIGIRVALGARPLDLLAQFVGRGLRLGVIGAAIGIAVSLGVMRLLTGLLFGVTATDPFSFALALAVVLVSALVATVIPAWRAVRIEPIVALRQQ